MEAKVHRPLKDSSRFNHLFPPAIFTEVTVKRGAGVEDTVKFIPLIVEKTKWQVEKFVEQELKGMPFSSACEKLWHFVKDHIGYKKDKDGVEQVRSPRRLFWEKTGDCDCYTVFLYACIKALDSKAKVIRRITKYGGENFQHIYPVVVSRNGEHIIMDCVTEEFNYEEPYTEKEDHMELTFLDGIPSQNPDAQFGNDAEQLGKLFDFLKKNKDQGSSSAEKKGGKLKEIIKKGLNVINKVNPATVLLRNGILAAMKLNFLKVAQRLKYAYLSDAEALKKSIEPAKLRKLREVKAKIEKIFYGAGGKVENLKNAILTGKGNEKSEVPVSGFYGLGESTVEMNLNTPLEKVLGQEIYYSENMQGLQRIEGLEGLGEPVTATSIGAASGVLASIAAILKSLGNIFTKKEAGAEDFENTEEVSKEAEEVLQNNPTTDLDALTKAATDLTKNLPAINPGAKTDTTTDNTDTKDDENAGDTKKTEDSFWERNKKWLKPTLWGTGILSLLGIGYGVYRHQQKKKEEEGTAGLPEKRKRKQKNKMKTIALK